MRRVYRSFHLEWIELDVGGGLCLSLEATQITRSKDKLRSDVIRRLFQVGMTARAVVLKHLQCDVQLSVAALEDWPGEMLSNPNRVFLRAEKRAYMWRVWQSMSSRLEELRDSGEKIPVTVERLTRDANSVVVSWTPGPGQPNITGLIHKSKLGQVRDLKRCRESWALT